MVDLHRTLLDESGEKRQGLSERERLQVGRRWFARSARAQRLWKPLQAITVQAAPRTSTCRA